ncbi:MAG: hypothetical protein AAGI63_07985 [Planctomycetota bacterium]
MTSATTTKTDSVSETISVEDRVQPEERPTLDSVVRAICADAKHDSLKFVLRSDTGHDGE